MNDRTGPRRRIIPASRKHQGPKDESWREIYERLETATPEEKTDIVLQLIEEHPNHRLSLPERDGRKAELAKIDLSSEALHKRRKPQGFPPDPEPAWLSGAGVFLEYADLRGANLMGAKLNYANLSSADLSDANLQGANLKWGNLRNTRLSNANLQTANLMFASLHGTELPHANLQGANLGSAKLEFTDLSHANLQDVDFSLAELQFANLTDSRLHGVDLVGAKLQRVSLEGAKLQGVDMSAVAEMTEVRFVGAWLDRTRMTRDVLGKGIGDEGFHPAGAQQAYLALKQNFDDLGDYDAASCAYCKERRMEKRQALENAWEALSKFRWWEALANCLKFFSDTLVEWLCNYGESVWRVIWWMAVLLFVVGPLLFSKLGGFYWNDGLVRDYFGLPSEGDRFWFSYRLYLLYTLDALTTASFSGLQPSNEAVKLASGFFAIAGIVLAGLLGFVAGNRIRRS